MATKAVKEKVETFATTFRPYVGKLLQISVEGSNIKPFTSKLISVTPGTLAKMKGLEPEKRHKDGKEVTPATVNIEFEDGSLFFIMEDVKEVVQALGGLTFNMGTYTVRFKEVV